MPSKEAVIRESIGKNFMTSRTFTEQHIRTQQLAIRKVNAGEGAIALRLLEIASENRWFTIDAETARLLSFSELSFIFFGREE